MFIEEWRAVIGFEGSYEVSSHGRIRSLDRYACNSNGITRLLRGRILVQAKSKTKYLKAYFCINGVHTKKAIHVVVAEAFLGVKPSRGMAVNHKDLNTLNNAYLNLEWVTPKQNQRHAAAKRMHLKPIDVATIKHFRSVGVYTKDVAKLFGIGLSMVDKIMNNTSCVSDAGRT
jgi:hypothetical protein